MPSRRELDVPDDPGRQDARSLPAQRAFVLQLHADADVVRGRVTGRVEHVASAQATHFETVEEILAFIGRVLSEGDPSRAGADHRRRQGEMP